MISSIIMESDKMKSDIYKRIEKIYGEDIADLIHSIDTNDKKGVDNVVAFIKRKANGE